MKTINLKELLVKNDVNVELFVKDCDDLEELSYNDPDLWLYNAFDWDESSQKNHDFWLDLNESWTQSINNISTNVEIEFGLDDYIEPKYVDFEEII